MRLGLGTAGRVSGGLVIAWILSTSAQLADAAEADAAHFSSAPRTLYATASAPTVAEGSNVDVLEAQETFTFDAEGNSKYTQYFVYKVLSPAGVDRWNALTMQWSPWRDQKPTMRARVISPDGTEYVLDQSTITDSPAHDSDSTLYGDDRMVRAPLPAIAPGVVVETEIVLSEKPLFVGSGTVGRSFFQLNDPVQHLRLTLEAPKSLTLRHRVDLLPQVTSTHTETDGLDRWVFDSGPMPPTDDVPGGLPSDVHAVPVITFSTGASWHEVAQAYHKIVAARLAEADVRELTSRLTKGRNTPEAKAEAIVEYLNREIRYTGVEFDQSSVIPHSTAEVLKHKYGDCKDKSLLLAALLRAAGINANLALLNAGERVDVPAELPGMGLFDHAIVYVPGSPALWIDATDTNARLGQLADNDRGRSALIIDPDTTGLTRVEDARSGDNVIYEEREIRLAQQGPAHVVEISKPRGNFESDYRADYADLNERKTKENLTDYVKSQYLAERVDRMARSDPADFSSPFQLTLEGSRAGRGDTSLSEAVAYIRLRGLFTELPGDLRKRETSAEENAKATHPVKKRVDDYQLRRPFVTEWHYRIVPPAGFEPGALPADAALALGPSVLEERFSADGDGVVHADLRFDTVRRRFTAPEQTDLRNKVADLIGGDAIKIKFDLKAHELFTQGHPRESFQAYRDLVAQQPKSAIQHLRRADGLLGAGMGEAARAEARVAVKLDPQSAFAQRTLAKILQHDLIGRWHESGADYAGAAQALRAAIALDPQDKDLVAEYAVLLEYDTNGVRYGGGADLKGAIEQYRRLTDQERDDLGMKHNVAYALFYSGDFKSSLEAAQATREPPLPLAVACIAQQQGVAQALQEARRRSEGDQKFRETVSTAGQMLLHVRAYPPAAALLEAGASGSNTARTMGLVSVLGKLKKHEDLEFGDSPEDLVRRLMLTAIQRPPSLDIFSAYQSRNSLLVSHALTREEREEQERLLRGYMNAVKRAGLTADVMSDIVLQAMQIKSSGDDAAGYRQTIQVPNMPNDTQYIVKEDGHYKLLDSGSTPVALALEVLDRVQRQDLAGAGTMLGWAREVMPNDKTDDPDGGNPFLRLWSSGQQQGDAHTITLAAAALLVQRRVTAERGITLLEQAAAAHPGDVEAENIDVALLLGYEQLHRHDRALAAATRLMARNQQSKRVFRSLCAQLRALNRFKEAEDLTTSRLQKIPGDVDALRSVAHNFAAQHDYAHAYEATLKVVASASSATWDANELAWRSLFFARAGGPDLDTAVRGAQLEANSTMLHTLACIYAEVGKTREAREVLLQAMDVRKLVEPDSEFWYALGRIAEQYGERDIALADYAKVTPPPDSALEYDSTYRLAQTRIRELHL